MNVEDVFLAVLDQPDANARALYLARACGTDSALRGQVEELLAAHYKSGEFLDVPAAEQLQTGTPEDNTIIPEGAMSGEKRAGDEAQEMQFLAPATRPDSLGRIGHYEVLQVLGQGGFGIVFRAFDDVLQRVVAIKVLAPLLAATSPARKRFLREAQSSAKIRHENVVQVYEVAEQPLPHLAMEFIPGETLQQRLDRVGPLDVLETLRIGRQIAEGLAAAHANDLIHRDIKPGNVLLEGGQHKVKITDFGLARAADDASMTQSGTIAGTPMYMAPEQALGHPIDRRADLFSLGSVLYQMISGRSPFRANTTVAVLKRVADEAPRNIREIIPETPQWLCDIIAKLHAKKPDDRFQSAREVADLLADCEAQLRQNSRLKDFSRIPRSATKTDRRLHWLAVSTVGFFLLACAVVGYFFGRDIAGMLNSAPPGVSPIASNPNPTPYGQTGPTILGVPKNDSGPPAVTSTWGTFVDPRGECGEMRTDRALSIRVPGTRPFNLLPTQGFNLDAPRIVQELEGDFLIQTAVTYERPRPETSTRPERPVSFRAAGLLVWVNAQTFLRFERAGYGEQGNGTPYLNMEWYVAGQPGNTGDGAAPAIPNSPTHLQIERRGQALFLRRSDDGRTWTEAKVVSNMDLPQRVSVGLVASNSTNTEFTAVFDNLRLHGGESSPSDPGWVQLFNGMDLTGWKLHPDRGHDWHVEQGVLVGRGPSAYLFSERSDYQNFHIRAEARINSAASGGLWVRSGFEPRPPAPGGKPDQPLGYAANIATFSDAKTGNLWYPEEGGRWGGSPFPDSSALPDEWFTLEVVARGNHLVVLVNGEKSADYTDPNHTCQRGHFALQANGPNAVVQFRKIEIKELPASSTPLPPTFKNGIGMEFVLVPKGKSWLGGGKDKLGDQEVNIPTDFYLGKYEVTQEEWIQVMGENPSYFSRAGDGMDLVKDIPDADLARFPVENVSWDQCLIFVAKLNKQSKETGWIYRLPSSAEWEYACRGGPMADKLDSAFDFYFAKPTNALLPAQANFKHDDELKRTCKVGSYEPNALGSFDMHGNVWEWCDDSVNGMNGEPRRVLRGGACLYDEAMGCRALAWATAGPGFRKMNGGLRLARVPSASPSSEAKTPPP